MDRPGSEARPTAEERKAILDRQTTAAVARGGRLEWWGQGSFEAVVSYHRYLLGRRWDYAFPLLTLLLVVTRPATADLLGAFGGFFTLGVIGAWFGRTRYERNAVDEDGGVRVAGAGLLAVAAGATLLAGLDAMIFGGAHLQGVIQVATERGYAYNFRLASLLLLGIMLVFGGLLCLTAVRGLARGLRRAWDRAVIGAVLLLLTAVPMTPLGGQGELAGAIALFATASLLAVVAAWRQVEPADALASAGDPTAPS